jgi:hypothetical protein
VTRLTNHQYLHRHQVLGTYWTEFQQLFAVLPFDQQRDVHAYYQPAQDLSDTELLIYRRVITKEQPSLPAKASKAFAQLQRSYMWANQRAEGHDTRLRKIIGEMVLKTTTTVNGHRTEASAVVSPDFDTQRLAKILIDYARRQSEREKGRDQGRVA